MESLAATRAFGALAQPSRLEVFRQLAREPEGLAAGDIAERIGVPGSTLSFHLQHLAQAGLVRVERRGRSLVYSIAVAAVRELFFFLGEDCCQGRTDLCAVPTERIDSCLSEASAEGVERPNVLFLCSRNSARSQIAEAVLRREAGDRFHVHSGGLCPSAIHPMALRVLDEAGFDTGGLVPKDLSDFLGKLPIHHAIVVCEQADADCPRMHPFARERLSWPFPDPVAVEGSEDERLQAFRGVRDRIHARIVRWLDEIDATERTAAKRAQ